MAIRPKTKHRLLILLLLAVCAGAVISGVYLFRERQIRHELNVDRASGMEAYRARDWGQTIARLTPYVNRRPDDAEAIFALGIAHTRKPAPDREDIGAAI